MQSFFVLIMLALWLSSCSVFRKSPKTDLVDGLYTQHHRGQQIKVYVDVVDDVLRIHPMQKTNARWVSDSTGVSGVYWPQLKNEDEMETSFSKHSFDIDFVTIPLKVRPAVGDVPAQMNTTLNGAGYFGYRVDKYSISYPSNMLGLSERRITHVGYSFGLFTGFGSTFLSPTNTNNILQQEYDGISWNKGVAGIFAVNNFTVGIAIGVDHLMDRNSRIWIYQGRPWFGLAFGLNLN